MCAFIHRKWVESETSHVKPFELRKITQKKKKTKNLMKVTQ